MDKLISIIVPCYNAESYVNRCFESLRKQTIGIEQLEIIFIDDGSKDGTWKMLTEIEAAYPESVIIIHCDENGRQGTARNIGLQYASGSYIGFVDSDDWVEPDMYEKLYTKMLDYQCDIVMCRNWRDEGLPGQVLAPKLTGEADWMCEIDTVEKRKLFVTSGVMGYYVWDKLFTKEFLSQNAISFPGGVTYEDHLFSTLYYFYACKVYLLEERLYHYYINPVSTVLLRDASHHFDILTVEKMVWAECENRGFFAQYRKEEEYLFLLRCYLVSMKMMCLRFTKVPYEFFLQLKEETLKRVPNYHANPYIKAYTTEIYKLLLRLLDLPISEQDLDKICSSVPASML